MAVKKKRVTKYLNNKSLLHQVILSKESGAMSDELAKMLIMLSQKYSKSPQFYGYSYRDDMEAFAMMMLVRTWFKFDETRSNNPFAFYTQCIKNSFIHFLKQEKKQRNIRDEMLVGAGLNPSHTFILEHEESERERHALQDEVIYKEELKEKVKPLYE